MKKTMILMTALLAVALISTQAFSWGHGYGMGANDGHRSNKAVFDNLSPEQQTQLRELHQKFIDDTYEMRTSAMLKRNQFRMLAETSAPKKAALMKLVDEMSDLTRQIREKKIDYLLAAKKIAPELDFGGLGMGEGSGRGDCPRDGQGRGKGPGQGQNRRPCAQ